MLLPTLKTACSPRPARQEVTGRLVSAFILSRLDYCNVVLAVFRHQHLHRCSELCTPLPELSTTLNHTTTSPQHSEPCIGFQSSRGWSSSCVCSSGHQQTGTCLPTEPSDNSCICAWLDLKLLGQQQWPCQAVNQTQIWWTGVLRCRTACLESAAHWSQSHHRHSYF